MQTLYAYVSRGLIRSEGEEGRRERRYYVEDVEKLLARRESRRNPEKLAQDALHWGAPVLESAITLIDEGRVYYRGQDVLKLATSSNIEAVAALIWLEDAHRAASLFRVDHEAVHISARKYETMLLHVEVDGAQLTPLQSMMTFLPIAAADDLTAYDLRPVTVAQTGARILRLMVSVASGDVPDDVPIAAMLRQGWVQQDAISEDRAEALLSAALVLCADHELNASSFTARVVASAGSTPYAVISAGLAALQGGKHGGHTERIEALLQEAESAGGIKAAMQSRLRRGESIPGFGHPLYPQGDPRGQLLLDLIAQYMPGSEVVALAQDATASAQDLLNEAPTLDTALVVLGRALSLPQHSPLALFALGRTVGWIGHAIEQYALDRLIRPRARYTGLYPADDLDETNV